VDIDTHRLRTLSLFSGIGGIDIGLQRWCKTVCYVELESYGQAALCKNMAAGNIDVAPIWDDITTFGADELAAIGRVDAITGGFPCQDISCAGKGAGITGERSGLFFEIIRLVRLARPRIIFLENVSALLGRGLGIVLGELSESGYDAKWKVLSAAEVGAPHRRDRIWIMANTEIPRVPRKNGNDISKRGTNRIINSSKILADPTEQGLERAESKGQLCRGGERLSAECSAERWSTEPNICRVAHGIPFRVDRLKCLGNAVVPQCCEKAFEILIGCKK